jgi:hypothetical protein
MKNANALEVRASRDPNSVSTLSPRARATTRTPLYWYGHGPRQLNGRLTRFVVRTVRFHAKTPERSEFMSTLCTDCGYEYAHCDYLIS